MAVHLICFTSNGGLPIFNRKRGDCENLPFSTTASLNGVYMFCKSKDAQLKSTELEDGYLVWKEYEDAVTIIAIANGMTEKMLFNLTELVFNAFVMFIGTNDFKSPNIFERMKREAKNYIPIIDRLMEACDNELFDHTDCILSSENIHILAKLNEFSTQFGSLFCCIIINQKLSVATEGWWDLDAIDQKLLIALLNSSNGPQRDVPVFLPKKSPNTAYRFVTVPITNCATLCVICGAEPPYQEINLLVQQIWKNDLDALQNAECCIPRNFPDSIEIDSNILGILLINTIHKKYVMSRNLQQSGKRTMSGSHRLDILRTFFYTAVDILDDTLNDGCVEEDVCEPLESYWCSEYHKCHAFSDKRGNLICVLYVASVPTYTMRLITENTLSKIIEEKSTCW